MSSSALDIPYAIGYLDADAVIFAMLGVALVRLGGRAVIERALVCLCALGSCRMNLLGVDLGSPRSVAVYAMPPPGVEAGRRTARHPWVIARGPTAELGALDPDQLLDLLAEDDPAGGLGQPSGPASRA